MSDFLVIRIYKHWLPVVFWMGFISFMSTDAGSSEHSSRFIEPVLHWLRPTASVEEFDFLHFLARKAAHLTEYAILGLLSYRALRLSSATAGPRSSWAATLLALLIAGVYAATDEYHQSWVPGRTPALGDVMIDTCGAAIALGLAGLIRFARSYWAGRGTRGSSMPRVRLGLSND